jgi:hypothetical protein
MIRLRSPGELHAFESTHSPQEGSGVHASVVFGTR